MILGDIRECTLRAHPSLSRSEQLILPDDIQQDKEITKDGAVISGRFIELLNSTEKYFVCLY